MKKILSLLLAVIMAFSIIPLAFAEEVTPVVMISGFGATTLTLDGEAVFPPSKDKIIEALGVKGLSFDETVEYIKKWLADKGYVEQLSAIVNRIMEPIRMDANGNSYYDIKPIVSGAENTSLAAFKANDMLDSIPYTGSEFLDMESIGERIGDENVFNFTYDWRIDYDKTADELKDYIDDVLELTGAKKVSIYSISQGSMVVGQCLYKYAELRQTDNIVFDTPVLGGTNFAADVLEVSEPIKIDYKTVFRLLSDILHTETDLTGLSSILEGDFIKGAVEYGRDDLVVPPVASCIAFWEMVPPERFGDIYPLLLDNKENAAVISAVKKFYSGFMADITGTFEKAERYGSTVSIKACTGNNLVTNTDAYSDGIVDMQYSCGAICAPYGESFPADYKQAVSNGKNSISPDRTVDISAGYWPRRTWVINGLLHGQVEWCRKSLELVETLLYTHDLKDAYSSYEFPQFIETEAPTADVKTSFNNTNSSFLLLDGSDSYTLTVRNLSKESTMIVKSIGGDEFTVDRKLGFALLPGESKELSVKADGAGSDTLTVTYAEAGKPFKTLEKSFGVTALSDYSGVSSENSAPENVKTPFIFRYIVMLFNKLFGMISK